MTDYRYELFRDMLDPGADPFTPDVDSNIDLGNTLPEPLQMLRTTIHKLEQDQAGRSFVARQRANLYLGGHRCIAWRGLGLAIELLIRQSVPTSTPLVGLRWEGRGPLAMDETATVANPAWPHFLSQHRLGIVRTAGNATPIDLIAEAARACPAARFVVFCRVEHAAAKVGKLLAERIPDHLGFALRDRATRPSARVVVGTLAGLVNNNVFHEYCDTIFVPDACDLLVKEASVLLVGASHPRLFGFLNQRVQLAPLDEDHLRCVYGFDELHIPGPGVERLLPSVVFVKVKLGPLSRKQLDHVELLRSTVWQDPVRNKLIARIATLLKASDRGQLESSYPAVAAAWSCEQPPKSLLIVVDTLEHAGHLLRHLPRTVALLAGNVPLRGLSRIARQQVERRFGATMPLSTTTAVVALSDQLGRVDWSQVDVVIRADAGVGLPALDPLSLTKPQGSDRAILVIDFKDRQGPVMRRRTARRIEAYWESDWFPAGLTPAQGRAIRFLRSRP